MRNQIIKSVKGPYGGFEISHEQMEKTPLKKIVVAIDGNELFVGCAMGLSECDAEQPCPIHEQFFEIRTKLNKLLDDSTILSLAKPLDNGKTFLKRFDEAID